MDGHRFIASVQDVGKGTNPASGVLTFFGHLIPLFTQLPVLERKGQTSEGVHANC